MIFPYNKTPVWIIISIDFILLSLSLLFSYCIRFEFIISQIKVEILEKYFNQTISYLFLKSALFIFFKVYQSIIRHTSIHDVKKIFYALFLVIFSGLALNIILHFINKPYFLPFSIISIDFLISIFLILGFRFMIKIFYLEINLKSNDKKDKENILIYGAGVSGLITKRTIDKDVNSTFKIIGFIDDSVKLKNSRLQGVKIYDSKDLKTLLKKHEIKAIIIAIQNPDFDNKNRILEICVSNNIKVLTVPSSKKWINGDFSTSQIKNINIEDLLGRNPIFLNPEKISNEVSEKIILVTGAAGSIGSGIVKQLANYNPTNTILLDQAESALYELEQELSQTFPNFKFEIVVGDVSNLIRMERLFEHFNPNLVFHAAAYKHVPLMEDNPSEAIYTNVLGTKNLVDLSIKFKVEKFVLISTDKAVNPTNVMGASKRIAEIYAQGSTNETTKFITTRFGNVLGSNGSVIPLFKKQIEQGGPITITDKRVTRFFMTIPEACQLVLEAGAMGNGGEIFVFDMGKPIKIEELAKKMIKLSGLEEGKDIEIKVTGLRPGEKLYEELLSKEENTIPTHHPKILKAKVRDNDIDLKIDIQTLINLFDSQNNIEIVKLMKKIVPEYISNNSEYVILDK
jgi:FlaA1/EpsC-like NDP-sugar epimerase